MSAKIQKKFIKKDGLTLIELIVVIAIIGILAAIAVPSMLSYINKARVTKTIQELKTIESALIMYKLDNGQFPPDLEAVGCENMRDSWGNTYEYLRVEKNNKGKLRKKQKLVPVNTDFDLYSKGKDGKSVVSFKSEASKDDIVRANNGGFFGLAENY
ncbi:MAG: type II secretion system protein GspG [Thermodesulfobacteriota bacterium]